MPETLAGSMLRALNEREVFDGSKFQKIPLRMMVVASNKLPYGEGFLAALDRIVTRIYLPAPRINEQDLFEKILQSGSIDKPTTVTLKELDAATKEILSLPISKDFYDFISRELRPTLTKMEAGLSEAAVSPRRWKQGMSIAQAQAWLTGADEVKPEHAIVYKDIVWNKEPQIEKVRSLIGRMCGNPTATLDGNTLRDEVKAIVEGHASDMQKATELGDSSSAAAAVTNKTKLWNDKLKEIKEDWHERFRRDDDYEERLADIELASQMMASCAQSAYSEVMES
jgi:MoxR-like ATPase